MTEPAILTYLENVKPTRTGWRACCPRHESKSRASLSITVQGGRTLLHDFGPCETADILTTLGLGWDVLFDGEHPSPVRRNGATPRAREQVEAAPDDLSRCPTCDARFYYLFDGERRTVRCANSHEAPGSMVKEISSWMERRQAQRTRDQLLEKLMRPTTLTDVIDVFQCWLYLPDPSLVHVVLATVAANHTDEDPLWLIVIGASSGGKTEVLNAIGGLADVHQAATMTEGSLLSGTPKRDAKGAKGGLLREIGDFGIIVCKDFTSVLSMNRDTRAAMLAALREIYDGAWTRHIGTDGGRTLAWTGKVGLLAGSTAAWDAHHAVVGAMGERFLSFRLPDMDAPKRSAQAQKALTNRRSERQMRQELAGIVERFFKGLDLTSEPPAMTDAEITRVIALGSLVTRCRSAVERDSHSRDIALILDTEAPARLTMALGRLYSGLRTIGLSADAAWPIVIRCGLDSLPKVRRDVFNVLVEVEHLDTTRIATRTGYPTGTTRRVLEDLTAHHAVSRLPSGQGKADEWCLAPDVRAEWETITFPEKSVTECASNLSNQSTITMTDFSGKVPPSTVPCPVCGTALGRHGECFECRSRPCSECGEDTGSAFWATCHRCKDQGEEARSE